MTALKSKTLQLRNVDSFILFGAGRLLLALAKQLKSSGYSVFIYTAPRQLEDILTADGKSFEDLLTESGFNYDSTDDINICSGFRDKITEQTLGLGFGEAWSFNPDIIDAFEGRLLDYMGIPLPQYRGGAHYTWALLNQRRQWGCHFQVINEEMVQGEFDSGELLFSDSYTIPEHIINPDDFFDFAVTQELKFVTKFVTELEAKGEFDLSLPDESQSLFFPRLHTLKNGWVNWQWHGDEIERFINAFGAPYAGASTRLNGEQRVFIKGCRRFSSETFHPFESGLITRIYDDKVYVIVDDGLLELDVISDGEEPINPILKTGDRLYTLNADLEQAMLDQIRYDSHGANNQEANMSPTFESQRLVFRYLTQQDCNDTYLSWLNDERINQYLETRWSEQSVESIQSFVESVNADEGSHLFGIFDKTTDQHLGNIKLGPINAIHQHGDVSYFIGNPSAWGKGFATEAIQRVCQWGFEALELETIQAGVYQGNIGSVKALEKSGFELQGCIKKQLKGPNGREDHLWFSRSKS